LGRDIEPVHAGGALVGLEQGGQDPDDGGLAGAVRAQQREDAAPLDVEVDAAQDLEVLVRLLQVVHLDGGFLDDGGHVSSVLLQGFQARRMVMSP
jgi:hypothetical protein